MAAQFNTSSSFLSQRLFATTRPRIGAVTHLNVNLLPDFIEYIKKNLTAQQLISLSEYQLQTYIMELSIKEKVTESFESFVERILSYVRGRKEFWTNAKIVKSKENEEKEKQEEKHQHEAIVQFQKDVQYIGEKMPKYDEKTFNNVKRRKIQQFFELAPNDFIDKEKQVLKLNFTNYSMMPAYVLEEYLKSEKSIEKLPKYQQLSEYQKRLLEQLENAVEYFLMQQRPKVNKGAVSSQRRQTVRERRLPTYLRENGGVGGVVRQQKIEEEMNAEMNSGEEHSIQQNLPNPGLRNIQHNKNQLPQQNVLQQQQKNHISQQSQSQSSQQDSPCQFYHHFHEIISNKKHYESRMFAKQASINQSHNMMEILRCLVYFVSGEEERWFERRWRELEEQRVMRREERKRQQEENDQQEGDEEQLEEGEGQGEGVEKEEEQKDGQKGEDQQAFEQPNKQKIIEQKAAIPSFNQPIECEQKSLSSQGQKPVSELIEIGIRKPIFDQQFKNPTTFSFKQLSRHLSDSLLSIREVFFLVKQYVQRDYSSSYRSHKAHCQNVQSNSTGITQALLDPGLNIDELLFEFNEMIEHPENVKRGAFKTEGVEIPWDQGDYLMFLKGLLEFFFIPTNNRKIALYMMGKNAAQQKNIESNHVKYVKGIYLKNMSIRIDRGESGGGKKGRMLGKTEFIQKDIEFFSMKWFDKMKKSKKKVKRRRFDDEIDAGEEADSAY